MNGAQPPPWNAFRLVPGVAVGLACASLVMVSVAASGSASTAGTVKVFFGQGDQLVARDRPGTTVQDALAALIAGPTSAELANGTRSYVPTTTRVRSVALAADVATVDLGEGFMPGTDTESTLARLDQVVSTVTAVSGIRAVRVLIKGGTPLGLFPGVDATVPLTREALATPNAPATTPTPEPTAPASGATVALQEQLVALGYLDAANADGVARPATQTGLVAFQKWQGLPRTGLADAATLAALASADRPTPIGAGTAGRWFEVLVDRQLLLAIEDDAGRSCHRRIDRQGHDPPFSGPSGSTPRSRAGGPFRSVTGCCSRCPSAADLRSTSIRTCRHSPRHTGAPASRSTTSPGCMHSPRSERLCA